MLNSDVKTEAQPGWNLKSAIGKDLKLGRNNPKSRFLIFKIRFLRPKSLRIEINQKIQAINLNNSEKTVFFPN